MENDRPFSVDKERECGKMDGILYEDVDILVCRKPAGLPVQSARLGQKDMVSELNNYLAEKKWDLKRKGGQEEIYVAHRLDQPVEGVMVFGKNRRAAAELGRQISGKEIRKVYRAVCCAKMEPEAEWKIGESRTLTDYLWRDGRTNTSQVVSKERKDAKRAELSYRILKALPSQNTDCAYLLAEIDLKTGRHHQIRVQMAHAGLPLYGDRKYYKDWESFQFEGDPAVSLALCAVFLSFRHPSTKKKMEFRTEPENPAFRLFE